MTVSDKIDSFFAPVVDALGDFIFWDIAKGLGFKLDYAVPLVVVWLIIGGIYFTIQFRFINFRGFWHALKLVRGKYDKPGDKGEVSHFKALTTALSATVGLGNIAGVAIAVASGGPGATFWMIMAGLLGMSLKFAECTMGLKYRHISKAGIVAGGPMYYLEEGLKLKKKKYLGKVLALIYAILIILASFGGGNMFQSNQAFAQLSEVAPFFKDHGIFVGLAIALLVGLVIVGGLKSIARVTSAIVPLMAGLYIATALIIIGINYAKILDVFALIIREAFTWHAAQGGFLGVMIMGFRRGAFSNEAGIGSASIAHAAAKTNTPIKEGLVALLEPFIDTVVICTMTAMVIIFTGVYETMPDAEGAPLTSAAFATVFSWFPYLLVVAIFLFAFSTMISWSYYGQNGFLFLTGKFSKNTKLSRIVYQLLFLFFIVLGATTNLTHVMDFSDMMILGLAFPNLLGLLFFTREIKQDLKEYWAKITQ